MKRRDLRGVVGFLAALGTCRVARAQAVADPWEGMRIEAVRIAVVNPSVDAARTTTLEDGARIALGLFPGMSYRGLLLDWGLTKVRRLSTVAQATAELQPGPTGGVIVLVALTVTDPARVSPRPPGFPYLFQGANSLVKLKVMTAVLGYANQNAWYGQPDAFVGANPLADNPSGKGWAPWGEGAAELGIQAIGPLAPSVYGYASISYLLSGSAGQELFTDETRGHAGLEDAYAGVVFGKTWPTGSRLAVNLSAGRQPFQISEGMLIRIVAGNGFDRAALQLNPRWAADNLFIAQARYDSTSLEIFQLDPDELPAIDTRTLINGINLETGIGTDRQFGFTFLHVPQSSYRYYTPTAVGTRAGLDVVDARFSWLPTIPGGSGPFARAELGHQWDDDNTFPMSAWGGYVEGGYTLAGLPWTPTLSYRFSYFSGDDPSTEPYERWDPLLSGGTPEEWVQGINHYKMFQDSNVLAHRLQARLQPSPVTQVVSQLWLFHADETNNLGGTLSTLAARPLGWEINLTAKYFPTRNLYVQGGVAATFPLSGVTGAIDAPLNRWFSAMVLGRLTY